ncbi:MAG TPA: zinc ABC transporter substrate-binding protein [Candidatus Dojkabacteria bacterium]|nr:zinc ABC transporter substrate-binding protein [Candidatus Dojkabacteria bacterium]HRO64946.1 zinc ABC transporter substrate-binding protein [Candidatus Dojkabacteria bacterium]HRP50731.1 zinc ABC transporter substrate-binding protein [Candidatus Dojkabacteria bacterium]
MKKLIPVIILLIIALVVVVILTRSDNNNDELTIVTTFYPPAEFTSQITKDKFKVINITSDGIEPHDFEQSPQDIVKIQSADLFIVNGNDFDHWAEELVEDNKEINSINLSEYITSELGDDPHFWLDPVYAIDLVKTISEKIVEIDEHNKEFYLENTQKYIGELNKLDQDFRVGLENCSQRKIVVSHDAFEYLGDRYDIEIINISGITPEEEPSAMKLAEISDKVKEYNIKYIFYETLVSPNLANTIAQETGTETLVLDPIEGLSNVDVQTGENYLSIMKNNLNNLKLAMNCE